MSERATALGPLEPLEYSAAEQEILVKWPAFNELLRRVYRLEQENGRASVLGEINGDPSKWMSVP